MILRKVSLRHRVFFFFFTIFHWSSIRFFVKFTYPLGRAVGKEQAILNDLLSFGETWNLNFFFFSSFLSIVYLGFKQKRFLLLFYICKCLSRPALNSGTVGFALH